jgi:hypothetical protein
MDYAKNLKRRMRRKVRPAGMKGTGVKRMKLKGFGGMKFGGMKGY